MILLLSAAAFSMEPPSFELLDDLDRWEKGMDNVMAGPQGCWDFTGEVVQTVTLHQPPDFFSSARVSEFSGKGTFKARLDEGVWGKITQEMEDKEDETDFEMPIVPLIGEVRSKDGDDGQSVSISVSQDTVQVAESLGKSVNLLRQAVDEWAGRTETALAQWDKEQQAVMLMREIPVTEDDHRPIHVDVRFPEAGEHADRIDAVWPRIVKVGKWPVRATIRDAQMHLLAYPHEGMSLPRAESLSLVVGFLGYTLGYEQTLKYRSAAQCTGDADAVEDQKTP